MSPFTIIIIAGTILTIVPLILLRICGSAGDTYIGSLPTIGGLSLPFKAAATTVI